MLSLPKPTVSILTVGTLVALALATSSGCGKSGPKTVPVSGRVTYSGKPVTKGDVVFQPEEVAKGQPFRPSIGKLQEDGTYRLSTFTLNDGITPGTYRIVVHSLISGPTPEQPTLPHVWAVPTRYTSTQTTPLEKKIPEDASGSLEFDFELTDK